MSGELAQDRRNWDAPVKDAQQVSEETSTAKPLWTLQQIQFSNKIGPHNFSIYLSFNRLQTRLLSLSEIGLTSQIWIYQALVRAITLYRYEIWPYIG